MTSDRSMRIAVAFARQVATSPNSPWCTACVEVIGVDGAGITLMGGDGSGPICVSNPGLAALEDMQFAMGQGPCRDAHHTQTPVHAPRLDASTALLWPSFIELAHSTGIGAVFAYPLCTRGVSVGVLTLYQDVEGDLSVAQHDDSVALAEILAETILSVQADEPTGQLAAGLEEAVAYRAEIYQASGVVAIQLSIPPADALVRIRGYAFTADQPLASVAADILTHRLWLTDDRQPQPEQEV